MSTEKKQTEPERRARTKPAEFICLGLEYLARASMEVAAGRWVIGADMASEASAYFMRAAIAQQRDLETAAAPPTDGTVLSPAPPAGGA